MKGYIVAYDDLQFDNQPVVIGATIERRLDIETFSDPKHIVFKAFATAVDRAAENIRWVSVGEKPRHRIFEVELHGPCVQDGCTYICPSITVLRECTPQTDTVPPSRRTVFERWSMMYVDKSGDLASVLEQVQPNIQRALATRTIDYSWATVSETELTSRIIGHMLYHFASQTTIAPSVEQLETLHAWVIEIRNQLQTQYGALHRNADGLWDSFVGFVLGWYHNPAFDKSHVHDICIQWTSNRDTEWWPLVRRAELSMPIENLIQVLRDSEYTVGLFMHILPCMTEEELNRIAAAYPLGIAHCIDHWAWDGSVLPESTLHILKAHAYADYRYAIDNQLASYYPTDETLRYTTNSIKYRIQSGDMSALEEAIRHVDEDIRVIAAIYGDDTEHSILVKDKSVSVRATVALYASKDIVHKLRRDRSSTVRVAVALRGFDEDLDVLVHDASPKVRKAVVLSARPQDIERLKEDSVGTIRKMATSAVILD